MLTAPCQITSCCIGAYYVLSWNVLYGTILYTTLYHFKAGFVTSCYSAEKTYQIKRHTVLCHSKNNAFDRHVSLHSVLCPREIQHFANIICYMFCTVFVPYILSCVLKYMGFDHTSSYYSALCCLILLNRIISLCILMSYQSLLCYIIFC